MIHSVDDVDNPGYEFQKIEEEETIFLFELMPGVGE
jgi:hypothetical protein